MNSNVKAVFRQGVFVPEITCDLPEGTQVELIIQGPIVSPPVIANAEERRRLSKQIAEHMRENPFPPGSPRFSREELHERG